MYAENYVYSVLFVFSAKNVSIRKKRFFSEGWIFLPSGSLLSELRFTRCHVNWILIHHDKQGSKLIPKFSRTISNPDDKSSHQIFKKKFKVGMTSRKMNYFHKIKYIKNNNK